jgi:uncharacterized protein (DUF58 family)
MGGAKRLFSFWQRYHNLLVVLSLLAAAWILALASGFWFFFRLAYVLSALVPLSLVWAWTSLRGLKVTVKRYTQRVQVGQQAEERIRIENRTFFPRLWLEVEDPSDMPGASTKRIISLNAGGFRSWRAAVSCRRRGVYTIGPLAISSGDPFGLFRMRRSFGPQHTLVVHPLPEPLPRFWAPPAELAGEGRQRRGTHDVTPNAASVREYEPGDSFSRIHWPTTARTGRLMAKTFELEPAGDVWIVLDLHRQVQTGSEDESTEEYGVRVACSVANHFLAVHRAVGYLASGAGLTILEPDRGHRHFARMLEALALARGVGNMPLADLLDQEGNRFDHHSTVIVITTSSAKDASVHSLQGLVERGVRVAVALLEASSFGAGESALVAFSALAASDILTYLVRRGDDLGTALGPAASRRPLAVLVGRSSTR